MSLGNGGGRGGINDVYFTQQVGNPFKFFGVLKVTDNRAFVRRQQTDWSQMTAASAAARCTFRMLTVISQQGC